MSKDQSVAKRKFSHAPVLMHLSAVDAIVNLVNGYIRHHNDTYYFTLQLRIIIMEYIMDIFLRFDTSITKCMNDIFENGTFIHRGKLSVAKRLLARKVGRNKPHKVLQDVSYSAVIFASSTGYDQGIHEWKIKVCDTSEHFQHCSFGIISDINEALKPQSMSKVNGDSYYLNYGQIQFGRYSKMKLFYGSTRKYSTPKWIQGDVITVHLNCNKWTCKFRINGKMVGSKFEITKFQTYYPAIESRAYNNQFELVSTKHIFSLN